MLQFVRMPDPSKLIVLRKAHEVLERVNEAAGNIRKPHLGHLKHHLIKTALSVPSNIAEGRRKESQTEFLRFLDIALGSNGELETQLVAARSCRAIPAETALDLSKRAAEVGRMLTGLRKKIREDLGEDNE
jgi:four helix bundle protein